MLNSHAPVDPRRLAERSAISQQLSAFRLPPSAFLLVLVLAMTLPALGKVVYVDDDAPARGNGSSWSKAYRFLQDGLGSARAGDEIRVAQGVYKPDRSEAKPLGTGDRKATFAVSAITLAGGYAGLLAADPNVRDVNAYQTILSGDLLGNDKPLTKAEELRDEPTRMDNCFHVVTARGTAEVVLDGLAVRDGYAFLYRSSVYYPPENDGGGLWGTHWGSKITLRRCRFEWNYAEGDGGGSHIWGAGTVILEECSFLRNASNGGPGGMTCSSEVLECSGCEFQGNVVAGLRIVARATATMRECVVLGNGVAGPWPWNGSSGFGGGFRVEGRKMVLINCVVGHNLARYGGGASTSADVRLQNCFLVANSAEHGGAIWSRAAGLDMANCSVIGNRASIGRFYASEAFTATSSVNRVTDCIINNGGNEIWTEKAPISISYTAIPDGPGVLHDPNGLVILGPGNIAVDPCLADPGHWDDRGTANDPNDDIWVDGDCHLKSQAGRWDPVVKAWVQDAVTSPCIDAGDPNSPIGLEPFPNGGRVNMGAYGGTAEASKSWFGGPVCQTIVAGDINGDCRVDLADLLILMSHWLHGT